MRREETEVNEALSTALEKGVRHFFPTACVHPGSRSEEHEAWGVMLEPSHEREGKADLVPAVILPGYEIHYLEAKGETRLRESALGQAEVQDLLEQISGETVRIALRRTEEAGRDRHGRRDKLYRKGECPL